MIALTPHHAPLLHEIHILSVDPAWSESSFRSLLELPTTCGFAPDVLSSFVLYSIVMDEAEILTLATHPDFRRQGIARQLLSESIQHLKTTGLKCLRLEVDIANLPAITLYESLDFKSYGTRPNYYKNSGGFFSDAKLMQLFL